MSARGGMMYQWNNFMFSYPAIASTYAAMHREVLTNISLSERQLNEYGLIERFRTVLRLDRNSSESKAPAIDVLLLTSSVHTFDCTDPRDRVFSLTGVFPQLNFRVDYARCVEEIYVSFASHLVMNEPDCLPALLICAAWHPSESSKWPSWVPDWRHRIEFHNVRDIYEGILQSVPYLPSECLEFTQASLLNFGVLTTCGFYVGFIASNHISSRDYDLTLEYPVITVSGDLAWINVRRDYFPLPGDLIFDIGRLFIVRSDASQQATLIGQTLYIDLCRLRHSVTGSQAARKELHEILDWRDCPVHDEPHSFASVCNRTDFELSRFRQIFPDSDSLVWFAHGQHEPLEDDCSKKSEVFEYHTSSEFPRSQCLTVLNVV